MGHARKWASVALSGLVAASLCLAAPGLGWAAAAGTEVLDWHVGGSIDAGGVYSTGERGSSKFNEYRDMDSGFVGELTLRGEKKDSPYFFDLAAKNPARDDQAYEGAFGRYGLFHLELGWDRTPHVLSNSASTIFQESNGVFTLPAQQRGAIATDTNAGAGGCPAGVTSWNCPVEYGRSTPAIGAPQRDFIQGTINGLLRPVDLSYNTDVGRAGLKLTPTEALTFDLEYSNLRRVGYRPVGTVIGSPGGSVTELAVPIDNQTHEVKFGAEYARPTWALQLGYIGSIFRNEFSSYTWDNPGYFGTTDAADFVAAAGRAVRVNQGQISAPPDNYAHTFNLTGSSALPWWRSRVSGTLAYTMLRQDETFVANTVNRAIAQTNADDAGNTSPDAKADIVLGNIQLTSRPIKDVTASVRYRFFEYQNDMPLHTFSTSVPEGLGVQTHTTKEERFQKQNAGLDLGWRPIQMISFKTGYEYERWNRADREAKDTTEHTGKLSTDLAPVDWLLGRVSYRYSDRYVEGYEQQASGELPQQIKFDQADRRRHRVDLLLQFTPWETFTPSLNLGYAVDDYYNTVYGVQKDDYMTAGVGIGWNPLAWLQFSADYTYERYKSKLQTRYRPVSGVTTFDFADNDWESKSKDEFHNVGLNAAVDLVPKKFDVTLGYVVSFGYTTIRSSNLGTPTLATTGSASNLAGAFATDYDRIQNILQTFKVVARYRLTEKLQARLGYAYERYTEKDFARDPMKPFMGDVDTANPGIQSVFLGATQPNYEANIVSFLLRYDF